MTKLLSSFTIHPIQTSDYVNIQCLCTIKKDSKRLIMKSPKHSEMKEKINRLTNELMLDYGENKKIDQLLPYDHPDKDDVLALIRRLMIIIYPGYYKNPGLYATLVNRIAHDCICSKFQFSPA